jgi:hypothetical protein
VKGREEPILTLRGVVSASVDKVAGELLDVGPQGRSPVMPPGRVDPAGPDSVVVVRDGTRMTVEVDRAGRMVSLQGEWWYRAEITLSPHEDGCLVTERIFNVAERLRWGVRFAARKPLQGSPAAFVDLLNELGRRLGRPARPLF